MPIHRALVAALALLSGCLRGPGVTEPPPPGLNVLFIGNSLTYTNNLPEMVADVARSAGITMHVRALARADHAVIDFLLDGSAKQEIGLGGWSYVVTQQGPTTLPICRDTLVMAVQGIEALARTVGARSVVMMSWPTTFRKFDFGKVHASAQIAAVTANAKFAPAGDAWQIANTADPSLDFYGFDGYHPSALGTYLAALVIVEQLTGIDVRTLSTDTPAIVSVPVLPRDVVRLLHEAAHTANVNGFATPVPVWAPSTPPVPGITC